MGEGIDGDAGEDVARRERRQDRAQHRQLDVLDAALRTSCWSTDTLSRTTIRRNAGSRQASRKADSPARTPAHGSGAASAAAMTAETASARTAS